MIAAESYHVQRMRQIAPDARNLHLLTDFDPAAHPAARFLTLVRRPEGFEETLAAIESPCPESWRRSATSAEPPPPMQAALAAAR